MDEDRREQGEHDSGDDGERQCAPEHGLLLERVAPPHRLRDEAGGSGPEEVEGGEDEIEDDGAGGKAADQGRVAELADDRRVDHADQRRRQIGDHHRNGDAEHQPVRHHEPSFDWGNVPIHRVLPRHCRAAAPVDAE